MMYLLDGFKLVMNGVLLEMVWKLFRVNLMLIECVIVIK